MATPVLGTRGSIVVQVEFDPDGAAGTYTNWCGTTGFSFNIANEVISTNVGDCDDWGLPIATNKSYGPQNVTASMEASWTAAVHAETSDWALNQKTLNVRILFLDAVAGQVANYDGAALLSGLDLGNIGNTDGTPQTESVTLEFSGAIVRAMAS